MTREWLVVHFFNEDSVEAVPSRWYIFNNNTCNWPPKSCRRYLSDFIKRQEMPTDDWDVFPAKILGQYDDFTTAKKKALKAQDTTDLSSTNEDIKRAKKKNRKFDSSTDDEHFSSDDSFPEIPKKKRSHSSLSQSTSQVYEPPRVEIPAQVLRSFSPLQRNNNINILHTPLERVPSTNSSINRVVRNNTVESERKEFQRQVMFQLNLINAKLSDHTDTLQLLLNQRTQGLENSSNRNALDDILTVFPLQDDMSLNKLEEFLQNKEDFLALTKELSRIGGDSAKELTKRIMYRTMTNEMGQLYSWDGAKGKRPFKNLLYSQVVLKAVRTNDRTRTSYEDETVKTIKQWLVRAKDRLNNHNKKVEKQYGTNGGNENTGSATENEIHIM